MRPLRVEFEFIDMGGKLVPQTSGHCPSKGHICCGDSTWYSMILYCPTLYKTTLWIPTIRKVMLQGAGRDSIRIPLREEWERPQVTRWLQDVFTCSFKELYISRGILVNSLPQSLSSLPDVGNFLLLLATCLQHEAQFYLRNYDGSCHFANNCACHRLSQRSNIIAVRPCWTWVSASLPMAY